MSKLLKNFIGIDISKQWFDVALIKVADTSIVPHAQFPQNNEGFKKLMAWLNQHQVCLGKQTLFCMEHTGVYNYALVNYLVKNKAQLWVETPLKIKKANGLERGKDDKSDAVKIAWYAIRYQDRIKLWQPADSNIEIIKNLIAQRDRIISSINILCIPVNELKECNAGREAIMMEKIQKPALKILQKTKTDIESVITKTIQKDQQIDDKIKRVTSIKGIGTVTAVALMVYTKGFTAFDNAKQLACYCGVVPFNKTSGSSVRYKASVSPFANQKLKKLLHLCALSAIKNDKELKAYFERKVLEGKNKMSIINAVRNKLLHRVFAVIRDERCFEDNYVRRCA